MKKIEILAGPLRDGRQSQHPPPIPPGDLFNEQKLNLRAFASKSANQSVGIFFPRQSITQNCVPQAPITIKSYYYTVKR